MGRDVPEPDGSSSYAAHERIFDGFRRDRLCLSSRDEVTAFAASLLKRAE
ncbi:hypothetical protein [Burkholderia ubonensis]|nr:hypothetical protein [Burkholderia ubonensis]